MKHTPSTSTAENLPLGRSVAGAKCATPTSAARRAAATVALITTCLLLLTAPAHAAPPIITDTSFTAVTETSATLTATVDPTFGKTEAHFEYTTLADFEANGFANAQTVPEEEIPVPTQVKGTGNLVGPVTASGDLTEGSPLITNLNVTSGSFVIGQTVTGAGIPEKTTITSLGPDTLTLSAPVGAGAGGTGIALSGLASTTVTNLTKTSDGAFGPGQSISGTGIAAGTKIIEAGASTLLLSNPATANATPNLIATGPQPIAASLTDLSPGTGYVFRAFAKKTADPEEEQPGPATTFYTFSPPPTFGACPNDELRKGTRAAFGAPGALLPDCRSFEMATPLAKNGNDALSIPLLVRAATDGSAVVFGSTFGMPGGEGAQSMPFYQAARDADGWTTTGLLAPAAAGGEARYLVGQLPDLSATYSFALNVGTPRLAALFELHNDGSPPTQITPTVDSSGLGSGDVFAFAGASADAGTVVLETQAPLSQTEGGQPLATTPAGSPNLFAWDRATGLLHLASVMNTPAETADRLPKGAYAGPYNWAEEILSSEGGPAGGYYATDNHVVSADGSIFFTSRSDGHLYMRVNPTESQSTLDEDGNCLQSDKACTLDVSASRRATPDTAGAQPAAFQSATADGSAVLFTSKEELTDDANTGPTQPPAQIGRATLNGEAPADPVKEDFLGTHALGTAVDPKGEYIYWADPSLGTIGRAKLNGEAVEAKEPTFIEPGEGECTQEVKAPKEVSGGGFEPAIFEETIIPNAPRYVAVDEGHVYWTNTGRRDDGGPIDGGGTIGRAALTGAGVDEVDPDFICGLDLTQPADPNKPRDRLVSNPQGIAVNDTHVYWANAAKSQLQRAIARAAIGGAGAEEKFVIPFGEFGPRGVALSATHVYFSVNDELNDEGYMLRTPLAGGGQEGIGIGEGGLRGLALDSAHLYWATQGEGGAIGRIPLNAFNNCGSNPSCDKSFLTPEGTPEGLAVHGPHLYFSVNGESPRPPGNDLYRYQPAIDTLTDLTPLSGANGAEVLGVLGASEDGSHVYFAANADLDAGGEAEGGDCPYSFTGAAGECSIYLAHEGDIQFIAPVATNPFGGGDSINWLPLPGFLVNSGIADKVSSVSADGTTLTFSSGAHLKRYRLGEGIACLSCSPTGSPGGSVGFGQNSFGSISPDTASIGSVQVRFASNDGNRVFFETTAALVGYDTDAVAGCKSTHDNPLLVSCLDIYEWEAPGTGTCTLGGPAYSPLNQGCLYLVSQGSEQSPALFAGASASGDDVFFFTQAQLVREDTDTLRDVYTARVGGGLTSQNPVPTPPCEGEGCMPNPTAPPAFQAPPQFAGPPNPEIKPCKGKKGKKKCRRHRKHSKKKHKKRRHHRHADRQPGGGR